MSRVFLLFIFLFFSLIVEKNLRKKVDHMLGYGIWPKERFNVRADYWENIHSTVRIRIWDFSSIESRADITSNTRASCQFYSVSSGIVEIFCINSKNRTKRNKFHLILNLGPFRIFWLNSARNVPVSFHMFRSALKKSLNQIEPCSIWLIKSLNYKKLFFITIFNNDDINNNIEN